ncbi:Bcr/CflA family efflux MFS transporter [Reinekea marina]|nr:Bcr/CflA family efflux MFS transporter [Reinekea marina]MDN3650984.1 Bcr/CflA family efflux MFS transporter [Reinekea marina]
MVNLLTSDVYVSAFPDIKESFATSEMLVGWSLSIFFIGSILTLPIYGPMSDRFGRKPVLMVGLTIFAAGSFGCFFSTTIEEFLVARFFQAMGVCSAYVLWQPMVVDIYPEKDVQKIFSIVMPFLGISPALGPLFGGGLTEVFSWRSIFIFLLLLNFILVLWTMFIFKESLKTDVNKMKGSVLASYRELTGSRIFIVIAITLGLCIGVYMAYLTLTPFLLESLDMSPVYIGLTFIPIAAAFGLGGGVGKSLCAQYSELAVTKIGVFGLLTGSAVLIISISIAPLTAAYQLFVPFMLVTLSIGITIPTGTSLVMSIHRDISGACSSGMNLISSLLAFIITLASAGLLAKYRVHTIGIVAVVCSVLAFLLISTTTGDEDSISTEEPTL